VSERKKWVNKMADKYADLLIQVLDLDDEDLKAMLEAIEEELENRE
jgi:hypothetical protein